MNEYVVRWEHWRADGALDTFKRKPRDYPRMWLVRQDWYRTHRSLHPALHGGKTVCIIGDPAIVEFVGGKWHMIPLASAETVCSWQDQFDRRVSRLYSLALALCRLDYSQHTMDMYDVLDKCACAGGPVSDEVWEQLSGYIKPGNEREVKRICGEIVQSWKHPPRVRTQPTAEQIGQWRAEKRAQGAE